MDKVVMGATPYLALLYRLVAVAVVRAIAELTTDAVVALAVAKVVVAQTVALELLVKVLLAELHLQVVVVVVALDRLAHLLLAIMLE
jgi:hypothetical protein